jgi:hypothetical protein
MKLHLRCGRNSRKRLAGCARPIGHTGKHRFTIKYDAYDNFRYFGIFDRDNLPWDPASVYGRARCANSARRP